MHITVRHILFVFCALALLQIPIVGAATAPDKEVQSRPAGRIDLNSATEAQLESLPGVGKVGAKKIIANRPYKTIADLSRAGLSENVIAKVKPLAIVKRTGTPRTPASATKTPEKTDKSPASAPEQRPVTRTKDKPAAQPPEPVSASEKVWLNTESNVYHREGDQWYGKTSAGKYVTEQEAINAGARESKHR